MSSKPPSMSCQQPSVHGDEPSTRPPVLGDQSFARVSTLVGDRLCIKCGYNLSGQSVLREPHYDMFIVRCPECATVASLQEHPLLGRWASRWAVVLVGVWIAMLLMVWAISSGVIFGFAMDFAFEATWSFAHFMDERQQRWAIGEGRVAEGDPARLPSRRMPTPEWWNAQDPAALRSEWRQESGKPLIPWSAAVLAVPLFFVGSVIALLVPFVRRRWLPLCALGVIGLSAVFAVMNSAPQLVNPVRFDQIAHRHVGIYVQFGILALAAIPLMIGSLAGRSLARSLVRMLLPPRMRGPLAGLWRIDGLPLR
jgi:hypothetical protein